MRGLGRSRGSQLLGQDAAWKGYEALSTKPASDLFLKEWHIRLLQMNEIHFKNLLFWLTYTPRCLLASIHVKSSISLILLYWQCFENYFFLPKSIPIAEMKLVGRTSYKSLFLYELFFNMAHSLTDYLAKIDLKFWYSSVSFDGESGVHSPSVSHSTVLYYPNKCSVKYLSLHPFSINTLNMTFQFPF